MARRVDAHHHLWDVAVRPQPWMDGPWADPLRRAFTPKDLRPLLDAARVDASVVVQSVSELDETRELLATAAETPWLAGVVGWADLTDPALPGTLAELRGGPCGDRLVGLRHQVHDEPDPAWLLREDVRRGLRAVAGAGLVYDLLVRTRELPAAYRTAAELPDLAFVVDHVAKPPIGAPAAEVVDEWRAGIAALAALPNVSCKLSGMVTEADWGAWRVADLVPYAEHVIGAFGPDRLMFGSDWPVCTLAAEYERVVDACDAVLVWCGVTPGSPGHDAVFGGTAGRVYGLGSGVG